MSLLPLLLPSNAPPPTEAGSDSPRIDFLELAAALGGAPLLYPSGGAASDLRQAGKALRQREKVGAFVSLSEKVGVPLALLSGRKPRVPHILVAHHLTSERKQQLQRQTRYLHRFSRIVVLCREQKRYLLEEVGLSPERVCFVYDKVDHQFFIPQVSKTQGGILSVGRERRDYSILLAAARLLPDKRFTIVSSSLWSQQKEEVGAKALPPNVRLLSWLDWEELRTLYAEAAVVVVPLEAGTRYAAGVNAVLEAMAMGKPLIVTNTPGIFDYTSDRTNSRVIEAANPVALASALTVLNADRDEAARLGKAGRQSVESGRNLDTYVATLAKIVRDAMAEGCF